MADIAVRKMEMADGTVSIEIIMDDDCYYEVISEYTGIPVSDEYALFHNLSELSGMQREYEKVKYALDQVRAKGYGIVMPDKAEIMLEEPELIKTYGRIIARYHVPFTANGAVYLDKTGKTALAKAPITGEEWPIEIVGSCLVISFIGIMLLLLTRNEKEERRQNEER